MPEQSFENIYYLGPDGSNTHNAMLKLIKLCNINVKNKIPQKSIRFALDAIVEDKSCLGVLPVENSIEGIVRETIDNFLRFKDNSIQVQGEITLPIKHMLLSPGKDKSKIKKIVSHPQALSQCSIYLHKYFPLAELKEVSSTSYAAKRVSEYNDETIAAIANEACAELFNLNILEHDINDEPGNKTRFYLLGRECCYEGEKEKTALMVSTKNHAGALCDVLKVFAKHSVNITCIDSRPSRKKMGEYLFFMELDAAKDDSKLEAAFAELNQYIDFIKILGSFKIAK